MNSDARDYRSRFLVPIHRAYRQSLLYLQETQDVDAASEDLHLLSYVVRYGPCKVGELARVFGHKKPTLTGILDRLERRRFITRRLNPSDRRSLLVRATSHGSQATALAGLALRRFEDAIAAVLDERDIEGFLKVLEALERRAQVEVRDGE